MSARRGARPRQQAAAPPAPRVEVAFAHLPTESRAELQRALLGWAHWHTQRYLPGYVPPSVASGRLAVEPARLLLGGSLPAATCSGWDGCGSGGSWAIEDLPTAPAALPPNFDVAYEQEGDVPQYDRATLRPLCSATGSAAGERRAALLEAAGEAAPGPLLSSTRCYNCGSYGHGMGQCFRERDAETEAVSLRQREEARAARAGGRRYWTILLGAGQGDEGPQASEPAVGPAAGLAEISGVADGPAEDYIPLHPGQQAGQGQSQGWEAAEEKNGEEDGNDEQHGLQQAGTAGAWHVPPPPIRFPSAPNHPPPTSFHMPRPPQHFSSPLAYPFQPATSYPHHTNLYPFAPPNGLPGCGHRSCPAPQQPQQPLQAESFGQQFGSQQAPQQQYQQYNNREQQLAQQLQSPLPPPPPPPQQHGSTAALAPEAPQPWARVPLPSASSSASASRAPMAVASSGSQQLLDWQPPIPAEEQHRWHYDQTHHTAHQQQWGYW